MPRKLTISLSCASLLSHLVITNAAIAAPESADSGRHRDGERSVLEARVSRLIEQLGAEEFAARERAQMELSRIGLAAFDALFRAQYHEDVEIAKRAHYLIRALNVRWFQPDDPPEVQSILKGYGELDRGERKSRIERLVLLEDWQGVEGLCRIVCYEESPILSKRAALHIMRKSIPADDQQRTALSTQLEVTVGISHRPAADWVRMFSRFLRSPHESVDPWDELVRAEEEELSQSKSSTDSSIVRDLMRWQVDMLLDLDRRDDATTIIRRSLALRSDDPDELLNDIEWLIEKRAWVVMNELLKDHREQIHADAQLLYRLAEAYQHQGDTQRAKETAEKAYQNSTDPDRGRLEIAESLRGRGLKDWAEREFRTFIDQVTEGSYDSIVARIELAEMLHDQRKELLAAQALEPIVRLMEIDGKVRERVTTGLPLNIPSRMHYFFSEHFRLNGEFDQQAKHIQRGLEADPNDADVLIAMFRMTRDDPKWQESVREYIENATVELRKRRNQYRTILAASNAEPTVRAEFQKLYARSCNEFAWLVSNTRGDFQEALDCSQKSLRIRPNTAGYLDTLGRCYYALGDYQNAVKYQRRAVEIDPHSGQLQRQLLLFEKALAESTTGDDN